MYLHNSLSILVFDARPFDLVLLSVLHGPQIVDVLVDKHVVISLLQILLQLHIHVVEVLTSLLEECTDNAVILPDEKWLDYIFIVYLAWRASFEVLYVLICVCAVESNEVLPSGDPGHGHYVPGRADFDDLRHILQHLLHQFRLFFLAHILQTCRFGSAILLLLLLIVLLPVLLRLLPASILDCCRPALPSDALPLVLKEVDKLGIAALIRFVVDGPLQAVELLLVPISHALVVVVLAVSEFSTQQIVHLVHLALHLRREVALGRLIVLVLTLSAHQLDVFAHHGQSI